MPKKYSIEIYIEFHLVHVTIGELHGHLTIYLSHWSPRLRGECSAQAFYIAIDMYRSREYKPESYKALLELQWPNTNMMIMNWCTTMFQKFSTQLHSYSWTYTFGNSNLSLSSSNTRPLFDKLPRLYQNLILRLTHSPQNLCPTLIGSRMGENVCYKVKSVSNFSFNTLQMLAQTSSRLDEIWKN